MSFLKRLFAGRGAAEAYAPLYAAIVAVARRPHWYAQGAVPDTFDGRFDMVSTILALVLRRLDGGDRAGHEAAARVTELFITDMDGQLRQKGIGDLVVGKHIGGMVSLLGGRGAAYRAGLEPGGDLAGAIDRNLYRGAGVPDAARAHLEAGLRGFVAALADTDLGSVIAGRLEPVAA